MKIPFCALCALLLALTSLEGGADPGNIGALRTRFQNLEAQRDSLVVERGRVAGEAEVLSARIDSLKVLGENAEGLQQALRASLGLVQRMVDLDRKLESMEVLRDSLREELRLSYDWEIGVLIQKLSEKPDRGLLSQLTVYEEAREALGNKPASLGLRYGAEMSISSEDGPDEIRQKMELMEDIAGRLRSESRQTTKHLQRLEEEHRLRARVRAFNREIRLFDEHLPEGRVLVRAAGPEDVGHLRSEEHVGVATAPGVLGQPRLAGAQGAEAVPEGGIADEVLVEIHKLKVRQQEINQLEEVVRERAETFRQYLEEMLEGGE